jgi:hypothetical protein
MQEINVYWTSPQAFEYLANFNESNRDKLYAVVGRSRRVRQDGTRSEKLFYLGLTQRHTFARINDANHPFRTIEQEHDAYWEIRVRVGQIEPGVGRRLTSQLVNEVEAAQIYFHQPPFNSRNTGSYAARDMLIRNRTRQGARAVPSLLTELVA